MLRKTTIAILALMLLAIAFKDFSGIGQGISPSWYFVAAMVSAIEATFLTAFRYARNSRKNTQKVK